MSYDTLILQPLRDMTVQVVSFIPTLLVAMGILFIGWIVARFIREGVTLMFKVIHFDKLADKTGIARFLRTGGLKHKPSELLGFLTYCVFMVMILILTVKSLGLTVASDLVDKILAYIPNVVSGAFVLIIGMYIARFVSVLVYIAAKNTDMPIPAVLARLSKLAIMVYVTIIYLKEIGLVDLFMGEHSTLFVGGIIFALSLAFGLAGRDIAAKYLDVFKREPIHHHK